MSARLVMARRCRPCLLRESLHRTRIAQRLLKSSLRRQWLRTSPRARARSALPQPNRHRTPPTTHQPHVTVGSLVELLPWITTDVPSYLGAGIAWQHRAVVHLPRRPCRWCEPGGGRMHHRRPLRRRHRCSANRPRRRRHRSCRQSSPRVPRQQHSLPAIQERTAC
jgi:hypothetical protein